MTTVEPYLERVQETRPSGVETLLLLEWQLEDLQRDRARNADFADYLRQRGFPKEAERLGACGAVLGYWGCGGCGEPRKLALTFCNMTKICPVCAKIERQQTVKEIRLYLQSIQQRPVYGSRLRHLVLPIKTSGCDEKGLRRTVERIWIAWRKLWRKDLKASGVGAKVFIEVGSKNGNVHMHILFYGPFIGQGRLSELWEEYTGDSNVVYITEGSGAVQEVVKYVTKGLVYQGEESSADLHELVFNAWRAFYKINRRMSYGIFRKDVLETWTKKAILLPKKKDPVEDIDPCPVCKSDQLRYVIGNHFQRAPPNRPVLKIID